MERQQIVETLERTKAIRETKRWLTDAEVDELTEAHTGITEDNPDNWEKGDLKTRYFALIKEVLTIEWLNANWPEQDK